jgi:hypothetical protein
LGQYERLEDEKNWNEQWNQEEPMNRKIRSRRFTHIIWLTLAALVALAAACNPQQGTMPASDAEQPPSSVQAPGASSEQDMPELPPSETIEVSGQVSLPELGRASQEDCPGVDSQLYQITQAPDPQELASQFLVEVENDKIQVLLELADRDITFLQDYDVQTGAQYGTKVQALVPISRLCELASTDRVVAIVRLDKDITQ